MNRFKKHSKEQLRDFRGVGNGGSFIFMVKQKKTSEHQQTDRTNKEIKTIKKNDTVNGTQRVNAIGR